MFLKLCIGLFSFFLTWAYKTTAIYNLEFILICFQLIDVLADLGVGTRLLPDVIQVCVCIYYTKTLSRYSQS